MVVCGGNHRLPLEGLLKAVLLALPVAALLVILADPQCAPQPLALPDLGVGHLVHLVRLQALPDRASSSSAAAAAATAIHLRQEYLAQGVAAGVDFVFVDSVCRVWLD